jgi:hypothetical protein
MHKRYAFVALLVLLGTLFAASDKPKPIYKITRLTQTQVGISCLNGADPTGRKIGDMVIMSCSYSTEKDAR